MARAAGGFVFASKRGGHTEIFVQVSGSSPRQLTRNRASDYGAVSLPDARRITFVSDRDADDDVHAVNLDGGGLRKLTRRRAAGAARQCARLVSRRRPGRVREHAGQR